MSQQYGTAFDDGPITKARIDITAANWDMPPVIVIRYLVTGTTGFAQFSKPTLQRINRIWKQYQKETKS